MPLVVGIWFCAASVAAASVAAETPAPELRAPEEHVTVQRVLLPVRVQAPWDQPKACAALEPAELRVFEDDLPVAAVEEVEDGWRPTLHLLLVDVSGSMRTQRGFVRDAARRYLERLEEDECGAVFALGDSLTLRAGITPDRARLRRGVDAASGETSTFLWDAIVELTRQFGDRPGRKALIVVTDGVDAGSLATYEQALDAVASIPEFSIFAIVPAAPVPGTEDDVVLAARERMKALARATGGEYFLVADANFLGRAFLDIRALLRAEIFVHYVPATSAALDDAAGVRRVRVELAPGRRGCRVASARRTRRTGASGRPPGVASPAWSALARAGVLREEGCPNRASLRAEGSAVAGCTLDAVLDHGLAWDPDVQTAFYRATPRLAMRRIAFPLPAVRSLPRSPAELVRRWLLDDVPVDVPARWVNDEARRAWGSALPERRPFLPSGTAWLALRRSLGVAMRDASPEYDAWLKRSLARDAAEHVEVARRALGRRGYGPEAIEAEAAFRRFEAESHAAEPTPYDAQEGLAGWLGDVSARRLAFDVERLAIERWLESEPGEEEAARIASRWNRLQAWFPAPLERRVVVLPSPILEESTGRIGFVRVVLPVPTLLSDRAWAIKRRLPDCPPDDRVPPAPYALALLRHLRSDPAYRDRVKGPGVRLGRFRHEELERGARDGTERGKRRRGGDDGASAEGLHRVRVELRGPALGERGLRLEALARTLPDGATTFEGIAEVAATPEGSGEDDPPVE